MAARPEYQKARLIDRAAARARRLAGRAQAAQAERFLRRHFANVSPLDLAGEDADNLAGEAVAFWRFGSKRRNGETKIRVYNPRRDRDGWVSGHSFVEIVTDDMPFLVDSVTAELLHLGLTVHLSIHPVFQVRRGKSGALLDIAEPGAGDEDYGNESFLGFEVTQQTGSRRFKEIEDALGRVLGDVRAAVADWGKMRVRVTEIIDEIKRRGGGGDLAEARDFLQWVYDDNFTLLGFREFRFKGHGARAKVLVDSKSDLGILRDSRFRELSKLRHLASLPKEVQSFIQGPEPIIVSKADKKSTVHRPVHMDMIGVKKFDDKGRVIGERLIVGLFTSAAYNHSPRDIPLLRRKLDKTLACAGFAPASHDGKALTNILETYPRDELFQISDDDLAEISLGIMHLQERQRVALFTRYDAFQRFVSCLVYVPRERYTTDLRQRLQTILEASFGGKISSYATQIGESPLARLHAIIATEPGKLKKFDAAKVEAEIADAALSWADHLEIALIAAYGEGGGVDYRRRYGQAFPVGYEARFTAADAVADIAKIEEALASNALAMTLYRPAGTPESTVRFKVFQPDAPLPLSDILPMLEHMGLKVIDEIPHAVKPVDCPCDLVMIHDFGMSTRDGAAIDLGATREKFETAFARVWRGEMESDGFNALVLQGGLGWREVVIIRTFAKYLRQARIPFSQTYMEQTLARNPEIARQFVRLFEARFDPALKGSRQVRAARIRKSILAGLDEVASADEDRILRRFLNLADAALRTNFYQPDAEGQPKSYLAIKFDSRRIDGLPLPRPMCEIFVYAPRVEGIHLRGGIIARGGIRWSDRPEDFRTEILGLMKAQMVKNAVIVPVGSKGGFVVKRPPQDGGRDAVLAEGIACYKILMSGLLDLTDNLVGNRLVPPRHVVRLDGDDPYLVVAADKGTATFSDIANGMSADYGFWLGDAFASGGSVGYDHKKMGITARGAWESVKRHFRETGKDIQNDDFTVVGVGDMSGDVFGNGMILSKHIKLIAAFNHRHIFVDPDPDAAASWSERRRLFGMARSSWDDYDQSLISKGGGVFERGAKTIDPSPEIRKLFALPKAQVTPNELIVELLKAETDLLWFGGIGTYIKASSESHLDAGDRANDAVRVDAGDLKCLVIGEGANLGVTQLGRVEYALDGGRLNTDSVDNSAGVDCSDHEVNIKILLDAAVAGKKLTIKARNKLLTTMTGEVGALVLRDNYLQTLAITMIESDAARILDEHIRLMRLLERTGRLDRAVEFLPNDDELSDRENAGKGLTRPEIAVIMPYAKIWLYDELLDSDLPDDAEMAGDLVRYFPAPLRAAFRREIGGHRLHREIITTVVTNSMINRVGGTFVTAMMEKTGAAPAEIARAYIITRDTFRLRDIWRRIEELDNKVGADVQVTLLGEVNRLADRATMWFLRSAARPLDIGALIKEFTPGIDSLAGDLESILPETVVSRLDFRAARYESQGVPRALARRIAYLIVLVSACDIVRTSAACALAVKTTARLYFDVGERFGLGWLRYGAEKLPADTHWQKLAADALIEELYAHQRGITLRVVNSFNGKNRDRALDRWIEKNGGAMEQTRQMLSELEAIGTVDLSMLAVASRHLSALVSGRDG